MIDVLALLKGVRKSGDGWTALCPAHGDSQNSLSVCCKDGKWLLHCHAGCEIEEVTEALGITVADLFNEERSGGGASHPSNNRATAQSSGLSPANCFPL
jgi:hypothetical protein